MEPKPDPRPHWGGRTVIALSALVLLGAYACGEGSLGDGPPPIENTGGGGPLGTGGLATGGRVATGGLPLTGGAVAGQGGNGTGGMHATGGATGGTTPATGGRAQGGSATGGSPPSSPGGSIAPGKKFVGNITTGYSGALDVNGMVYAKYWDQITPENAGKWGSVQSNASAQFNWATLDKIYDYAQKNHVVFKQHNFIWGAQQPGGTINEAAVKNWMTTFCQRYPETKVIDVVNEPPPHTTPSYANNIGGGTNGDWKWITNAFTWARAACPNAILVLNDYNNIEWDNDENHFIDIVKKIKAAGAPIDAVGCQAHDASKKTTAQLQKALDTLHTGTGLPLYITEYDVSDTNDTNQLNIYKQQFPLFYETDYIHGITIWGWIFGQTWSQAANSGLVKNTTPRPAMTWLMQQLGRPSP